MLNEAQSKTGLASQAAELKQQLEANCRPAGKRAGRPTVQLPHELHQDLLRTLDSLVSQLDAVPPAAEGQVSSQATLANPPTPQVGENPTERENRIADLVTAAIDHSLAGWQARITCSFQQTATAELQLRLDTSARLVAELENQQRMLETQRLTYERELETTLQLRSRLTRQRKTLADHFRIQRLELQRLEQQLAVAQQTHVDDELEVQREEIRNLQNQLAETLQRLNDSSEEHAADSQQELQRKHELEAEIDRLRGELDTRGRELGDTRDELSEIQRELQDANSAVAMTHQDRRTTDDELNRLQTELIQARDETARAAAQQQETEEALQAARDDIQTLEAELLNSLETAQTATEAPSEAVLESLHQVELLEQQLDDQHLELEDLRSQNSDLAAQIAKLQVHATGIASTSRSINQESLSWEERKVLILQQLADDVEEENETTQAERLDIEEILRSTQREIERRDREIADLQTLVEQQSDARDGVAIGAAAIAQMLDADQLINQERQKLKDIQHEWEEKLRQAEIDLSMERAKLARERIQLEMKIEQARNTDTIPSTDASGKALPRTRKWLEHLGLKENKGD